MNLIEKIKENIESLRLARLSVFRVLNEGDEVITLSGHSLLIGKPHDEFMWHDVSEAFNRNGKKIRMTGFGSRHYENIVSINGVNIGDISSSVDKNDPMGRHSYSMFKLKNTGEISNMSQELERLKKENRELKNNLKISDKKVFEMKKSLRFLFEGDLC